MARLGGLNPTRVKKFKGTYGGTKWKIHTPSFSAQQTTSGVGRRINRLEMRRKKKEVDIMDDVLTWV